MTELGMGQWQKQKSDPVRSQRQWPRLVSIFLAFAASQPTGLTSCGRNVVESYAPDNEQEKAELDMEAGRFTTAAERLTSVIQNTPDNHTARSLLAAAYAAQAGITTLGLIKNVSSAANSGSGTSRFNSALPDVSAASLELMGQACDSMALIPIDSRTSEMTLQYRLFFAAYAFLQIKYFTTNAQALATMSTAEAVKLIETLARAADAGGTSPLTKAAATFSTTISASEGSSLEKVKTVLTPPTP